MDITVARQPIFDDNYNVIAYELLYKDGDMNVTNGNTFNNMAESILYANTNLNFGINNLVDNCKAFVNFDSQLINTGVAQLLNKEKIVIEVSNNLKPNTHIINQLKKIKYSGYILAMDNFTIDYNNELIKLCDIVKIDFSENTQFVIKALAIKYKRLNKLIMAKKVETKDEFDFAESIGFNYYHGFYFSKPSIKPTKELSGNVLQYMKLMEELSKPEPNNEVLSNIILVDVALTYKLLKLVNSNKRFHNEISSIKQALAILGTNELRKWLSVIMIHDMGTKETNEAVKYSLIRSNFLRQIAMNSNFKRETEELALLGTLSVIDTILETNMENAITSIPITDELKHTLLGEKTLYSDVLKICLAYECGAFKAAQTIAKSINCDSTILSHCYLESVAWADEMFLELKSNQDE